MSADAMDRLLDQLDECVTFVHHEMSGHCGEPAMDRAKARLVLRPLITAPAVLDTFEAWLRAEGENYAPMGGLDMSILALGMRAAATKLTRMRKEAKEA